MCWAAVSFHLHFRCLQLHVDVSVAEQGRPLWCKPKVSFVLLLTTQWEGTEKREPPFSEGCRDGRQHVRGGRWETPIGCGATFPHSWWPDAGPEPGRAVGGIPGGTQHLNGQAPEQRAPSSAEDWGPPGTPATPIWMCLQGRSAQWPHHCPSSLQPFPTL